MLSNKSDLNLVKIVILLVNLIIVCLMPYFKVKISKIFGKDKKGITNLIFLIIFLMYINIMASFLFILFSIE